MRTCRYCRLSGGPGLETALSIMRPVNDEQAYRRLKWTVLNEAEHHHSSSIAYYWARHVFPNRESELDGFVQRVLLELLDAG
jgi:hypothetical protein